MTDRVDLYRVLESAPPTVARPDETGEYAPLDVPKWSGAGDVPALGSVVLVTMNRLGPAKVVGYFVQHNWLGLLVELRDPPGWYILQNGGNVPGHVFGAEIAGDLVSPPAPMAVDEGEVP